MKEARAVLGMDIGGTKIALAVCDLDGHCVAQEEVATRPEEGGPMVLARAISAGRALLAGVEGDYQLAAIGISTIGVPLDSGVELAPAIPGWEGVALARSVGAAFGVPVKAATDVKAAAAAEARSGALAGSDQAIYLNLGTGLAAAIVVGGRVVEGAHGAAGGNRLQRHGRQACWVRDRCSANAGGHRVRNGPGSQPLSRFLLHRERRPGFRGWHVTCHPRKDKTQDGISQGYCFLAHDLLDRDLKTEREGINKT